MIGYDRYDKYDGSDRSDRSEEPAFSVNFSG